MSSQLTVSLPIDLATPEQLSAVAFELQTYVGTLHDARVRTKSGHHSEPPTLSALLQALLNASHVDADDSPALEQLQSTLATLLTKAPTAHLVLAALPARDFKRQITLWFRTEIHPLTLLTFTARPDIGGGVIIRAGSHVYDYSFRRHILENKQRISELAFGV